MSEEYMGSLIAQMQLITERAHRSSSGVERVIDEVDEYARVYSTSLDHHAQIAPASGDPITAFVMTLILENEQKQQRQLGQIARTLHDALEWTNSTDALPSSTLTGTPPKSDVVSITRTAREEEQSGAQSLRQLAHRCKDVNGGLISLLFETMAEERENHRRMFDFIVQRSTSQRHAAGVTPHSTSETPARRRAVGTALRAQPEASRA